MGLHNSQQGNFPSMLQERTGLGHSPNLYLIFNLGLVFANCRILRHRPGHCQRGGCGGDVVAVVGRRPGAAYGQTSLLLVSTWDAIYEVTVRIGKCQNLKVWIADMATMESPA